MAARLKVCINAVFRLCCWPVYLASCLFPRDKRLWAFGSTSARRFADNPKYLYLHVSGRRADAVRAVWLTRDDGLAAELRSMGLLSRRLFSPSGVYHALRAGVWVFDHSTMDISYWLSGGAVKVNLWHGTPLKKIAYDDIRNKRRSSGGVRGALYRLSDPDVFETCDFYSAPSFPARDIFASAFALGGVERVLVAGYPRNDVFAGLPEGFETGCDAALFEKVTRLKKDTGVRVVTYMPTFRDGRERGLFDLVDPEALRGLLESMNACLLLKPHPQSKTGGGPVAVAADRVFHVSPGSDVYPFLTITDVLATDYSSVYFDFLLTGRPILFFPYDLADYLRGEREMYFDYHAFTPGPKARDGAEFIEALKLLLAEPSAYAHEREALRRLICAPAHAKASERLYRALSRRLLEPRSAPGAEEVLR